MLATVYTKQQPGRSEKYMWMEGGWRRRERRGRRRRARGLSLLWQAKTAAVLKLKRLATALRGCLFVPAYIYVRKEGAEEGETQATDGGGREGHPRGPVRC